MEIKCTYNNIFEHYLCYIEKQQMPENQKLQFIGQHEAGKSNKDVTYVQFISCTITKVPQGLTTIFPNLKILEIWYSKLKKITKNDLIEYKNLEELWFCCSEIEFLPGDLFEGFKNFEKISFYDNKLKVVAPNIFDGLEKLECVNLIGNVNYNKLYEKTEINNQKLKTDLLAICKNNSGLYADYMQQDKQQLTFKPQKSIIDDIQAFIQDESTKDFKIVIDSQEFPVHKFLLAARSSTLAEILKNNPEVRNLNLIDFSVEIFEKILKFLYTDELPGDDKTNFMHLFAAADKLKIKELKEFTAIKIINNLNHDNAVDILKISNKYDHEEMRFRAFKLIKNKYPNNNFDTELAVNMDKLDQIIARIKRKEKADKEMEEMFSN